MFSVIRVVVALNNILFKLTDAFLFVNRMSTLLARVRFEKAERDRLVLVLRIKYELFGRRLGRRG